MIETCSAPIPGHGHVFGRLSWMPGASTCPSNSIVRDVATPVWYDRIFVGLFTHISM